MKSLDFRLNEINTICVQKGYEFLGFVGDWRGNVTKLRLRCAKHNHTWETTTINKLQQGRGCSKCKAENSMLLMQRPDGEMVDTFLATGSFCEGTLFSRSGLKVRNGGKKYWFVSCPKCSCDEYVQAGLCSGVFKSTTTNLQKGNKPCRCSSSYRWNRQQREYQINKRINQEGLKYTFIDWEEDYKNLDSKFNILCHEHGLQVTSVRAFLYSKSGCVSCAKNGFDPSKPSSIYVILAQSTEESFTGYGISNVVCDRLRTHKTNLRKAGFDMTAQIVIDMPGDVAYTIESALKQAFQCAKQRVKGFITESTNSWQFSDVVDFVNLKLKEYHV